MWTINSKTASALDSAVYTTGVPRECHRPDARMAPSPVNAVAAYFDQTIRQVVIVAICYRARQLTEYAILETINQIFNFTCAHLSFREGKRALIPQRPVGSRKPGSCPAHIALEKLNRFRKNISEAQQALLFLGGKATCGFAASEGPRRNL